jgi:enoyl-CoA hydratase/carnithine racemase
MSPPLTIETHEGVAVLTLSRPERRNALSLEMLQALERACAEVEADAAVRVLVIAAEGPAFSAGHDLRELQAHRNDPDEGRAFFRQTLELCARVMTGLARLRQPVIAAVEGVATAAGCQLVASCDLAVAGAGARFATPGVNIGLFCTTPMVALTRNLAAKPAMEMLLTGEMIDAATALRVGLVNRVAPAGQGLTAALELAARIAAKPERITALGKAAFHRQRGMELDEAYDYASGVMLQNMLAEEAREGFSAFLDKRSPNWR